MKPRRRRGWGEGRGLFWGLSVAPRDEGPL